jgi:hypothetical protein
MIPTSGTSADFSPIAAPAFCIFSYNDSMEALF